MGTPYLLRQKVLTSRTPNWWDVYFASGEDGRVFMPSQHKITDCLWTNTGRTTAATDGDSVAVMDDLSGNGDHLVFVAAHFPVYRAASDSLEFIDAGASNFDYGNITSLSTKSIFVAAEASANDQIICYLIAGTGQGVFSGGTFGSATGWGIFDGTTIRASTVEDLDPHYTTAIADGATNSELRVDGASITTAQINTLTITMIGARPDSLSNAFEGFFYGALLHQDDLSSDITTIEAEMATLAGL